MSTEYRVNDIIWRWWDAGISMEQQILRIVRVNRLTVTVATEQNNEFRLPYEYIGGHYTESI